MLVGGAARELRQLGLERGGELAPAPGAAEVEAVEMGDLAVRPVRDGGRSEQASRLSGGEIGQEEVEPRAELIVAVGPPHAQRLGQRRGEELVPARLPRLAVAIAAIMSSGARSRISPASGGSFVSAHSRARIIAKAVLKWVPTRIG